MRPAWQAALTVVRGAGRRSRPGRSWSARRVLMHLIAETAHSGAQISAMTRFDGSTLPEFGLPATLAN